MATTLSSNIKTVKPLGARVLIKVAERDEKTSGGIYLPETAKETPQVGEVISVGPGQRSDSGEFTPLDVSVGARVLYSKYSGTEIKLDGDDYVLLAERDLLAVIE